MKRLIRKSQHGENNRDYAIIYINGKIYTGEYHSDCIKQYLSELGYKDTEVGFFRDEFENNENLGEIAFAHFSTTSEGPAIFLETEYTSYDKQKVINVLQLFYPGVSIYDDDSYDINEEDFDVDVYNDSDLLNDTSYYQKIGVRKKRLVRKCYHDFDSRDEALTIIDGKIYTAFTHGKCINKWLKENGQPKMPIDSFYRPHQEDYDVIGLDQSKVAFAHLRHNDKTIYIDDDSLQNMTLDEAAQLIKNAYPDYSIYNDSYVMKEYENGDSYTEYPLLIANKQLKENNVLKKFKKKAIIDIKRTFDSWEEFENELKYGSIFEPFEEYYVPINFKNWKIAIEGWYPNCLESINLGETNKQNIMNNYVNLMQQQFGFNSEKSNYLPDSKLSEYGVSYISKEVDI